MKLIFLDIDGVLNHGLIVEDPERPFDKENLDPFNEFIQHTQAKIVISSSWRFLIGASDGYETKEEFFQFLYDEGLRAEIIDVTPDMPTVCRGVEIQTWLTQAREEKGLHIEDYLIFEDDVDDEMPREHLIETDFDIGLTKELAQQAIQRFS
ncbi:MAG TPA: hypothetical protein DCE42_03495 [Myxococcales bacterium]|nr:hypothetical protein [Deltaproteobacteria bacterium]HAA53788.1 hypothetical protein [Myxococcales bacterium]|tara:strand:+ start:4705 stop:5160 length:456 start_codon:yes stop_codon:yes gene_type:complete